MTVSSELPAPLRAYVLTVIAAGPLVVAALALARGVPLGPRGWITAVILTALLTVSDRFPLELTHHTRVNVSTVALLAIVLAMPLGAAALMTYVAIVGSQATRRRGDRDWLEGGFNAGQLALCVAAAAVVHDIVRGWPIGPGVGDLAPLGAIVAAALALHVANTALVAAAAALQLERSPARVFVCAIRDGTQEHAVLSALAVVAGLLATEHPWALPIFGLPTLLVRSAQSDGIRVRTETRAALATLVDVVELSDPYTAGHSQRVAALGRKLALRVEMTAEAADLVEAAGKVHDLGKVAIDGGVLMKPGRLTDEERLEMERHPVLGADVVANFAAYAGVYRMVRHHHERWDGAGYPDGLAGEAIPLGARILAVADTFDALTSDRPYRAGMSVDRALVILRDGAGSQWDVRVVGALLGLHGQRLERAAEQPSGRAVTAAA